MMLAFFQVGLGGALGAMSRFGLGLLVMRAGFQGSFPIAVLAANILGCFLMGVVVVLLGRLSWENLQPFLMTGLLGGFTTFSAFSLEAITLYERGLFGYAALYVVLSVFGSLSALALGLLVARGLVG